MCQSIIEIKQDPHENNYCRYFTNKGWLCIVSENWLLFKLLADQSKSTSFLVRDTLKPFYTQCRWKFPVSSRMGCVYKTQHQAGRFTSTAQKEKTLAAQQANFPFNKQPGKSNISVFAFLPPREKVSLGLILLPFFAVIFSWLPQSAPVATWQYHFPLAQSAFSLKLSTVVYARRV